MFFLVIWHTWKTNVLIADVQNQSDHSHKYIYWLLMKLISDKKKFYQTPNFWTMVFFKQEIINKWKTAQTKSGFGNIIYLSNRNRTVPAVNKMKVRNWEHRTRAATQKQQQRRNEVVNGVRFFFISIYFWAVVDSVVVVSLNCKIYKSRYTNSLTEWERENDNAWTYTKIDGDKVRKVDTYTGHKTLKRSKKRRKKITNNNRLI